MNVKQVIPLVAAVGLALVAGKVAHDMSAKKTAAPTVKAVQVVIAKGPVGPGTALTPDMLDVTSVPGENQPAGTVPAVDTLLGRVTTTPLFDGQPVRLEALAPKGAPSGLAALVPSGMRAVTVNVTETSSVAGLITPGCHVDIVSTLGPDNDHMIARTVAQDVMVIAVGQRLSATVAPGEKDTGYRTVTLIANPRTAELINLASNTTRCRLSLRGNGDKDKFESDGVKLAELRGHGISGDGSEVASIAPAMLTAPTTQPAEFDNRAPHHTTEVIRGGAVSKMVFPLPTLPSGTITSDDPQDKANYKD